MISVALLEYTIDYTLSDADSTVFVSHGLLTATRGWWHQYALLATPCISKAWFVPPLCVSYLFVYLLDPAKRRWVLCDRFVLVMCLFIY